jgi:hypothetical protein
MNLDNLHNYESEEASPKPKATINSYRSFGYTLQTAVADIVDNSITAGAKNVWIDYIWNGNQSSISFLDDGVGMDLTELIDAMTPGSKDPVDVRPISDLGRFGLGLKTASFSQCKSLTVSSRKLGNEIIKRCWNLDYVNRTGRWILLDYISDYSFLENLDGNTSGTLVIWEQLDRLTGNSTFENESVRKIFLEEFNILEKHLAMIFHRYLNKLGRAKLKIWLNGSLIESWDPFLISQRSQHAGNEVLYGGNVTVNSFILPHLSAFKSENDRIIAGGLKGWYEQQGFYIYRNDRLLVAGDWLGLFPRNDHSKLARISIDFTNTQDHEWDLDIKKSTARPPSGLKRDIERIGKATRKLSGLVYGYRGTILKRNPETPDFQFEKIWNVVASKDGSIDYKINKDHFLVKKLLDNPEISKSDLNRVLDVISENIPIETIIYYHNEDPGYHEFRSSGKELNESVVSLAKAVYYSLVEQGVNKELAIKQIFNIEPFNLYPQLIAYFE